MKIFYYLFHVLCYVTFILPATCSFVDPDQCSKYMGQCRRTCDESEKRIDLCFSPRMFCCVERLFEDD
ncbi:beta-defensin 114 [Talpa occidentalis]|uniref:beta-defensin 114 n=1 Tax=Talpa occidentalis TaxID=50954 RepID=UPI00189036C4|nr:beta-defensin 114 [Talpa occidentalis]